MVHIQATDNPAEVHALCDRCGKRYAILFPLSVTALIGVLGSLMGEHIDCAPPQPVTLDSGVGPSGSPGGPLQGSQT